ncbi:MAG TPA: hypothetical protein VE545_09225 [Candidatus Dormibacteraeota bacterium]|nr:hypothetical protein [Candidatus Dormibacteraeota bacterium]
MQDISKDKWMVYGLDKALTEAEPIKLHTIFEHSLGHDTQSSAIARAEVLAGQNLDSRIVEFWLFNTSVPSPGHRITNRKK